MITVDRLVVKIIAAALVPVGNMDDDKYKSQRKY